jgi:hypothetical protein
VAAHAGQRSSTQLLALLRVQTSAVQSELKLRLPSNVFAGAARFIISPTGSQRAREEVEGLNSEMATLECRNERETTKANKFR